MRGHQLVMCNIDQQILLHETLDSRLARNGRDDLERCGSDIHVGDQDPGVVIVSGKELREGAHLLDAHAGVG